ncbi:unnamed protein product [Arctia plantaginis]|uniref:Uncharacterized protein n=1 Tax=Arctia plantaginis TaxID=874455 RepID=A0A8S1BC30_ARCPL|nr:unnamed protein product [Arctia plantaginis]
MKILPLFFLLACVMLARAQEEGETRSRIIPKRGSLAKGKTTTTTTPAPQVLREYGDEGDPLPRKKPKSLN